MADPVKEEVKKEEVKKEEVKKEPEPVKNVPEQIKSIPHHVDVDLQKEISILRFIAAQAKDKGLSFTKAKESYQRESAEKEEIFRIQEQKRIGDYYAQRKNN